MSKAKRNNRKMKSKCEQGEKKEKKGYGKVKFGELFRKNIFKSWPDLLCGWFGRRWGGGGGGGGGGCGESCHLIGQWLKQVGRGPWDCCCRGDGV